MGSVRVDRDVILTEESWSREASLSLRRSGIPCLVTAGASALNTGLTPKSWHLALNSAHPGKRGGGFAGLVWVNVLGKGVRGQAGGDVVSDYTPSLDAGAGGGAVGCSEMEGPSWHGALVGLILC